MKRTPVRESLARQTGLTTSVLISTLILLAHVLFGWAQLSDTETPQGVLAVVPHSPRPLPSSPSLVLVWIPRIMCPTWIP